MIDPLDETLDRLLHNAETKDSLGETAERDALIVEATRLDPKRQRRAWKDQAHLLARLDT